MKTRRLLLICLSIALHYSVALAASLPVLHLNGTAFENGYQHGRLLKGRIHELVGLWKKELEAAYHMPADRFIEHFLDSTDYIPSIQKWTPGFLEEIKGISEGSEVDFSTLFAFQLTDEIWTNARMMQLPHHCTSAGINNFKKDGSPNFLAQNIDITPFYHGFEILLDIKDPRTGKRTLVTSFAGCIGANGMNRSIGITVNSLLDLRSSLKGLPVSCIVRGVLEKGSFIEAAEFLKAVPHASGQNYTLGSARDIVSLECASDLVTEYWPDSEKLYTFHANRPLANTSFHPSFVAYITKLYGSLPESVSFSDERLEAMKNKISGHSPVALNTLKEALCSKPICNSRTFVSTLMEFGEDYSEMQVSPGRPDSTSYSHFRIREEPYPPSS
jgi:isopenicillin-N N-acyltransferase like protein